MHTDSLLPIQQQIDILRTNIDELNIKIQSIIIQLDKLKPKYKNEDD